MVIYSQQNKQDLITQDFQSNQAVGKPIGNKEKLGVSRNWMRRGGTVQWDSNQKLKKAEKQKWSKRGTDQWDGKLY